MPPAPSRPNILLILTDQQRADTLAAAGSVFGAATPGMDRLCRRGVTFNQAFCTSPICGPARATLMTGRYPTAAGVHGNLGNPCSPLSQRLDTVAHRLQAAGYQTAYHGKWHLGGDPSAYGFEVACENSHDPSTTTEAARFYRNRDWIANKRPFFHVVSYLNPHDIYFLDPDAPPEISPEASREGAAGPPAGCGPWPNQDDPLTGKPWPQRARQDRGYWTDDRLDHYRAHYAGLVEKVDRQIDELLDELRCGGFANNTWVIFTSDHGDMAGEHGLAFKGPYMYDGVMRVPLVVAPPDRHALGQAPADAEHAPAEAVVSPRLTSHVDLVPTVLDLAELAPDPALPGRSLLPTVRGVPNPPDDDDEAAVFGEWHQVGPMVTPIRMIRTARWKYTLYLGIGEELYDLENDPHEQHNLIPPAPGTAPAPAPGRAPAEDASGGLADPEHEAAHQHLRRRLLDWIASQDDPFFMHKVTDAQGRRLPT